MKKKALVSLYYKEPALDLLNRIKAKFDFISTGGTFDYLKKNNIKSKAISTITEYNELLDGRVKSLHPKVYASILARKNNKQDLQTLAKFNLSSFDLVLVNFYPFAKAVAENLSAAKIIEFVDIGGPAMLRSAAKNYRFVIPLFDEADYGWVSEKLEKSAELSLTERKNLAAKAFQHCSNLDQQIADELSASENNTSDSLNLKLTNKKTLRYGENPHQKAVIYETRKKAVLNQLEVLQGKSLSYNNYLDLHTASQIAADLVSNFAKKSFCAVIKHNNPCGLAVADNPVNALFRAWAGDSKSAFGSIIIIDKVNLQVAKFFSGADSGEKKFFEILLATEYQAEALELLQKTSKAILLKCPIKFFKNHNKEFCFLDGVALGQDKDLELSGDFQQCTKKKIPQNLNDLIKFGLVCCKHSKSNAISLVRKIADNQYQLLANGFGQPNRIDAFSKLALPKLQENLKTEYSKLNEKINYASWYNKQLEAVVLISDAFFSLR